MIGIPNQTIGSLEETLEEALGFGFGHISLYML
jgi:coproporphyrinogen III oxidase-like Fe-S oxidoreductase